MTTPSDPNDPGYGQQSGLPSFPAAPPPTESAVQTYTPPTEMTAAFWCYVVAAVISLIGGVLAVGQKQAVLDTLKQSKANADLTPGQLDTLASAAITFAIVVAVVIAGLYLLFAFKLRAGRNWARIVLTVVAALALLSLLFSSAHTVLSYIGELAAVAGAVLSWMPNSSAYIAAVRASRFR
jgi:hypothetical protein